MNAKSINQLGTVIGGLGMLACLVMFGLRVAGQYYLVGIPAATIFLGGIALIVAGCFLKLHAIAGVVLGDRSGG
ncbi:hypothetical protein ACKVEX_02580 [Rhodocyclaceae bacterium SMB388]